MTRILVVTSNWIGDVVCSTPFLHALRRHEPESHITCLTAPRCAELLEDHPAVDALLLYDEEGQHRGWAGIWRGFRAIRRGRFEEVYLLHRSCTKAVLALLAGARHRIGLSTPKRWWALTHPVSPPEGLAHRVDRWLAVARAVGMATPVMACSLGPPTAAALDEAEHLLRAQGVGPDDPLVAVHPGANGAPRRWPWDRCAALGDRLQARGLRVALVGGAAEVPLSEAIRRAMHTVPVVLTGQTTLKGLAALFTRVRAMVGNDSGPLHVAAACGAPTVGLFGATRPEVAAPRGTGPGLVLYHPTGDPGGTTRRGGPHPGLLAISVEEVVEAVLRVSAGSAAPAWRGREAVVMSGECVGSGKEAP